MKLRFGLQSVVNFKGSIICLHQIQKTSKQIEIQWKLKWCSCDVRCAFVNYSHCFVLFWFLCLTFKRTHFVDNLYVQLRYDKQLIWLMAIICQQQTILSKKQTRLISSIAIYCFISCVCHFNGSINRYIIFDSKTKY